MPGRRDSWGLGRQSKHDDLFRRQSRHNGQDTRHIDVYHVPSPQVMRSLRLEKTMSRISRPAREIRTGC